MGRWSVLGWAGAGQVVQRVGGLRVAQGPSSSHTCPSCHLPGSGPPSQMTWARLPPARPLLPPELSQSRRPSLGQQAPLPSHRAPRGYLADIVVTPSARPGPGTPRAQDPLPSAAAGPLLWEKRAGSRGSTGSDDPVSVGLAGLRPKPREDSRRGSGEGGRWAQAGKTDTPGKPRCRRGPAHRLPRAPAPPIWDLGPDSGHTCPWKDVQVGRAIGRHWSLCPLEQTPCRGW